MTKRKNRKKAGRSNNYYRLFLIAMCAAMGQFPRAPSGAKYEESLKQAILMSAKKNMARLGQIWLDPEMPDDWESVTSMLMLPCMKSVSEYAVATESIAVVAQAAAVSASDPAATPAVLASTVGVSTEQLVAAQSWTQNTSDWWNATWSGDWDSGAESFGEGWDAFWSGNW